MTHSFSIFEHNIDVTLERLDGKRYSLNECGIGVRDFAVSSPYYATEYESIEGADGAVDNGTTLGYRQIKMELYFVSDGVENYANKRDEVFSILDSREPFYVIESRNPHKRWKVKIDGIFTPDQERVLGFFDVTLVSASPFAQSPGTTLNMQSLDYYYPIGAEKISDGDPILEYTFSENTFAVFNDSDADVDPRNMDLKIVLKGNLNNPIIRNLTTGDIWSWNGSSALDDEIVLDGIRSLKNGQSIFGQTNKKLIRLAPGWNYFEVLGATDFVIDFDFRFYYL